MRQLIAAALAAVFLFAITPTPATASVVRGGDDESIGSLPEQHFKADGERDRAVEKRVKVKPGESYTNPEGVTIVNDANSTGDATITTGTAGTKIRTKAGFKVDTRISKFCIAGTKPRYP